MSVSVELLLLLFYRVMVTSVLADRHPGELHIFRNYDPPSVRREAPYATTATFKPLTIPQGTGTHEASSARRSVRWWATAGHTSPTG